MGMGGGGRTLEKVKANILFHFCFDKPLLMQSYLFLQEPACYFQRARQTACCGLFEFDTLHFFEQEQVEVSSLRNSNTSYICIILTK